MTDNRLKPCPFCGSGDIYILGKERIKHYLVLNEGITFGLVTCNECFASVRTGSVTNTQNKPLDDIAHQLYERSVRKWNTRTGETVEEVSGDDES